MAKNKKKRKTKITPAQAASIHPTQPAPTPPTLRIEGQGKVVQWTSPLPPPETLAEYEKASPGSTERLIRIVEAQVQHRHSQEKEMLRAKTEDNQAQRVETARGQRCALVFTVSVILASVAALWIAPDEHGASIAKWLGGSVLGLVAGCFIVARWPSKQVVKG